MDKAEKGRLREIQERLIGEVAEIVDRVDCKPGKTHLFRVTSPIDTVEHCEWCHHSRPCQTFVGERADRPLKEDQQ